MTIFYIIIPCKALHWAPQGVHYAAVPQYRSAGNFLRFSLHRATTEAPNHYNMIYATAKNTRKCLNCKKLLSTPKIIFLVLWYWRLLPSIGAPRATVMAVLIAVAMPKTLQTECKTCFGCHRMILIGFWNHTEWCTIVDWPLSALLAPSAFAPGSRVCTLSSALLTFDGSLCGKYFEHRLRRNFICVCKISL